MSGVSVYFLVLESASRAAFEAPQGREENQRFSHHADRYCVSLLHDQGLLSFDYGFSAAATLSRRGVLSRLKMMAVNGAKFHAISRTLGEKLWGKSVETVVDALGSHFFWWVGRVPRVARYARPSGPSGPCDRRSYELGGSGAELTLLVQARASSWVPSGKPTKSY